MSFQRSCRGGASMLLIRRLRFRCESRASHASRAEQVRQRGGASCCPSAMNPISPRYRLISLVEISQWPLCIACRGCCGFGDSRGEPEKFALGSTCSQAATLVGRCSCRVLCVASLAAGQSLTERLQVSSFVYLWLRATTAVGQEWLIIEDSTDDDIWNICGTMP